MDCETCDRALLDLVCGELGDAEAADVRRHAASCETCGAALRKLEVGSSLGARLERDVAPALDAVLAAARARAVELRPAPTPPVVVATPDAREPEASWVERLFESIGAMVLGPQMGVVAVLGVVVGIGLWYLPQIRGGHLEVEPPSLESDVTQDDSSPLTPAEPLQFDTDPRTGRVVSLEEAPPSVPEAPERRPAPPPRVETIVAEAIAPASLDESSIAPLPAMPSAAGAVEGTALPDMRASDEGIAFDPPADPSGAAVHAQARAMAAAGRCLEALEAYSSLLQRTPPYSDLGHVWLEMADCQQSLGRVAAARASLERAAHSTAPSVAAEARRALTIQDARERASSVAAPTAQ